MTEIEVPLEKTQENIQELGEHEREGLMMRIALSSAFLAGFAAVAALLAGHHANEAMIEQIRASDQWSYYQAKGIKAAVLASKHDTLRALGKEPSEKELDKLKEYSKEQEEIKKDADEKQKSSEAHLRHHVILARAVTMFQVAIAVAAISALTRRRRFWFVSVCFGVAGIAFLLQGLLAG